MKTNRSMKDIHLTKLKTHDQNIFSEISPMQSPSSLTLNLESLLKSIKNVEPKTMSRAENNTKSQKNLVFPTVKFQFTVNSKPTYQEIHTARDRVDKDRSHDGENVEITPFDTVGKPSKASEFKLNILSPCNRNLGTGNEPKRPKILSKQRQSLSFYEEFKLGKVLGKGRFGNVYRAHHLATGCVFAVKQISLQKACSKLIERLIWEIKIQSFLRHEHCLQLYKFYKQGSSLFLVVELGECSLFDKLRQKRYFTEVQTCYYVTQTIRALMNMHSQGVIHRDIKPENIVLINNVVKLADFGWSIFIGKNNKRTTFCGTLDYVSPEIVMGAEYDEMVDVWSVGVLAYELSTGHAPFQSGKSREDTYRKILNVDLKFPKYLSDDIKEFIGRLLTRKPEQRMSLQEALQHRWVKKYFMK